MYRDDLCYNIKIPFEEFFVFKFDQPIKTYNNKMLALNTLKNLQGYKIQLHFLVN